MLPRLQIVASAMPASMKACGSILLIALFTVQCLPGADTDGLAAASNRFAPEFYQGMRGLKGNFAFSPYSLHRLLALAREGATGATKQEFDKVLHIEGAEVRSSSLGAALGKAAIRSHVTLSATNHLWASSAMVMNPDFLRIAKDGWNVLPENVDFSNPAKARRQINAAVSSDTRGRISALLPDGAVESGTALVLASTVFFKGLWSSPFTKEKTKQRAFYSNTTRAERQTAMMQQTESFNYAAIEGIEAVALPVGGEENDFEMLILLPVAKDGLSELEAMLKPELMERISAALRAHTVTLMLPRFAFSTGGGYTALLHQLGLKRCFEMANANFEKMSSMPKGLFLSAVFHETTIEVSETGVEAAAATEVAAPFGSPESAVRQAPRAVFNADHSFVFVIRHPASGLILFLGRFDGP